MVDFLAIAKELAEMHLGSVLLAFTIFVIGYFVIKIINKGVKRLFDKTEFDRTLEIFVQRTIKIVLWIILVLIILSNLGFDISAFIAGIGVAGFIIGFAAKDTLGNMASGLMIFANKPFKIGDEVVVAGTTGVVKEMSISTCVVITKANEYVIIPNSKIWGNPIKNLSRIKPTQEKKPQDYRNR
jgi:small conductance mechanosensitive channel